MTLLEKIKLALRITVSNYDSELTDLISAAQLDLGIAGVVVPETLTAIVERAIITYCKVHFSALTDGEWSYDEQKAQLATATGYTDWLGVG